MISRGLLWALVWSVLVITSLLTRPLLPIDETRYLSVAWEMWQRAGFLVPYLNGSAYSHKPPLLFWLMQAGWWLWGVSEWWPRLVHPLAGALALWLTLRLSRRLWPEAEGPAALAPGLVFGTAVWLLFLTAVQFDLLLVVCTLLAMLALLHAAGGSRLGWLGVGLALGLGGLTKGPVILLHVLPAALAAPFWAEREAGWGRWYLGLLLAVVVGAGVTLAWALPAGWAGGEAYRNAIFWGQTAGRVTDSFAHAEPWWWYLPLLPLGLLPWSLWPRLWRAIPRRGLLGDRGVRFLLAWAMPVLGLLSLVSGKQLKYLLPVVPALALLAARWLDTADSAESRESPWLAGLCLVVPGLAAAAGPLLPQLGAAKWLAQMSVWWGLGLIALGMLVMRLPRQPLQRLVPATLVAGTLSLVILSVALAGVAKRAYDLSEVARRIAEYQSSGHPVLNVGKYHGQYQFLGRLTHPLDQADSKKSVLDWVASHPDGYVIIYGRSREDVPAEADYAQLYRGDSLSLWSAKAALAPWGSP